VKIEIDTDSEESLVPLRKAIREYNDRLTGGDTLKKALERAFNPRGPEPALLGTLVRDDFGLVVIKSWMDGEGAWSSVTDSADTYNWEDLAHPVTILAEGVPSHVWKPKTDG
jgi:hypothetical protein